jgi:hypothetical protein
LFLQNFYRYKDGKGDPKAFKNFLRDHNLPRGLLPRYRGNRLHVLFHICSKLHQYHELFVRLFSSGTASCGGLVASIAKDFQNPTARAEMQALGLLGKLLTGPWMKKFYQSASGELRHLDAVDIVRTVVDQLEEAGERPLAALARTTDFLGQDLDLADETLQQLRCVPVDSQNFSDFFKSCCVATPLSLS